MATLTLSFPVSPHPLPNRRHYPFHHRRCHLHLLRCSSEPIPAAIEVVGIGSRKDAVIDFCLNNSSSSSLSRFRFWTFHSVDSKKAQLLQRSTNGSGKIFRDFEYTASSQHPPAVILVASAGHGVDHIPAVELLNSVKSTGGIAAAILLKPFGFEGQRRLEEVDLLVQKLQVCSQFYIVVEEDSLLKAGVETLTEALESVNNAVFLAIKAIYVMISEVHLKVRNTPDGQMKEIKSFEVLQLLETYEKAKVGFGVGYNLRTAIMQAVYHCPFLPGDLKDLSGIAFFTLSCACDFNESDLPATILNFRQFTECPGDIIFSRIHEPEMEPNLYVITLLISGSKEIKVSQMESFLSSLSLHFPYISSFLRRDLTVQNDDQSVHFSNNSSMDAIIQSVSDSMSFLKLTNSVLGNNIEHEESQQSTGESSQINKGVGEGSSEASYESTYENNGQTRAGVHGDDDSDFIVGSEFHIAQLWANDPNAFIGSKQMERQNIFTLPVGVKSSEPNSSCDANSKSRLPEVSNLNMESVRAANFPSIHTLPNTGLETFTEIYNSALSLLKGRNVDERRKRGLISERAASMLESERDSTKSWTPTVEMQYRGGIYKGRCQGGLPEGKGCLTFTDGSFFDGMWHYGKRSGLGTFYYSNGDVFQGSWRDDLMHGKGWFYFYTGDRWFVNFWKGKANGEGRFYSKNGSIFFGCFQNGWRHGEGLCIDIDGSRWTEFWEEGILVSRTLLENTDEK